MREWLVHPPSEKADAIGRSLRIHPIVIDILLRRGIHAEGDMHRFLNPSLDGLQSPSVFFDMEKAVSLIRAAVAKKEKILVYGDYDVDGVTAAAILVPVLKSLGADVQAHLPHRIQEGYGLNRASLESWMARGVSLVITVDNGITSVDAVRSLKERGVGVILVDHHVPKDETPPADAIISGGLREKPGGDVSLAACGLAFKLGWALLGDFKKMEPYLDLVTLGTVADLAPVEGENRILLKWGLPALAHSKRPGIRALMNVAGIHPQYLSYRDIAFGLGPRINAAGRMGSPMEAFRLLVTENDLEARNLAQLLDTGNRERQKVESQAYKEASRLVEEKLPPEHRHVLVVESPEWHEGVLGIVAARLVERFHRPSIVISMGEERGKGSGRSLPHFSLFEHLRLCEDLFENFGGHAQACGLTIRKDKLAEFRGRVNELARETLSGESASGSLLIEGELAPGDLDTRLVTDLERLAPFGPGNPRPLFVSRGMRLRGDVKKRGKDTLQCWMTDARGKLTCEVIGFRSYERWQAETQKKREFDIVYQPTLRNSNGIASITLELESWR